MEANSLVLLVPEDPPWCSHFATLVTMGVSCLLSSVYLYAISVKPLPSNSQSDVMYVVNDEG